MIANGGIGVGCRVTVKRLRTEGRVPVASAVVNERSITTGGIVGAGGVTFKRGRTNGRVVRADAIGVGA